MNPVPAAKKVGVLRTLGRELKIPFVVVTSFVLGAAVIQWRYDDEITYGEARLAYATACAVSLDVLAALKQPPVLARPPVMLKAAPPEQ